ncbi:MAG: dTDP-4-dehydrorhamnose reductase [Candidatus Omnitrophota bacterium]
MRVLIVGSLGQLGSDLVSVFSDCQVTPYDLEDMDITDEALVQQQIAFISPDLVVNAAAFTRVDECERECERAFRVNALGPRNLALACRKWDVQFVHIGTNYVFDGEKGAPYLENDRARPVNAYGITKLAGEDFVRSIWDKHYIVRISGLFGLTPSRMKGTNFVEAMLRLGSKGNPLRIVADESLSPTSAKDAAIAIRRIVEKEIFGLYHVCNQGCCTWLEFAEEIFRQAGMNVALEPVTAKEYGAPARRPPNSCLEMKKLQEIGVPLPPLWQDALREYLDERQRRFTEAAQKDR